VTLPFSENFSSWIPGDTPGNFPAAICHCDPVKNSPAPKQAEASCTFRIYFYDQFADAADWGIRGTHKKDGAQEYVGGRQFDEIGAWGQKWVNIFNWK
jgi:hypothetical protein